MMRGPSEQRGRGGKDRREEGDPERSRKEPGRKLQYRPTGGGPSQGPPGPGHRAPEACTPLLHYCLGVQNQELAARVTGNRDCALRGCAQTLTHSELQHRGHGPRGAWAGPCVGPREAPREAGGSGASPGDWDAGCNHVCDLDPRADTRAHGHNPGTPPLYPSSTRGSAQPTSVPTTTPRGKASQAAGLGPVLHTSRPTAAGPSTTESCMPPTQEGALKPQVLLPGQGVLSGPTGPHMTLFTQGHFSEAGRHNQPT